MATIDNKQLDSMILETITDLNLCADDVASFATDVHQCLVALGVEIDKVRLGFRMAVVLKRIRDQRETVEQPEEKKQKQTPPPPVVQEQEEPEEAPVVQVQNFHVSDTNWKEKDTWAKTTDQFLPHANPSLMMISSDHINQKGNQVKKFGFIDRKRLHAHIMSRDEGDRYLYEFFGVEKRIGYPMRIKPYFDFDLDGEYVGEGEMRDAIISNFVNRIVTFFNRRLGCSITAKNIMVEDASVKGEKPKTSFHIKVIGVHFSSYDVFKKITKTAVFESEVLAKSDPEKIQRLDGAIYGSTQSFRLPFCNKMGKSNHLRIVTDHNIYDGMVTDIKDGSILIDERKFDLSNGKGKAKQAQTLMSNTCSFDPNPYILKMIDIEHVFIQHFSGETNSDDWFKLCCFLYNGGVDKNTILLASNVVKSFNDAENRIASIVQDTHRNPINMGRLRYFVENVMEMTDLQEVLETYEYVRSSSFKQTENMTLTVAKGKYDNEIMENFAKTYSDLIKFDEVFYCFDKRWKEDKHFIVINNLMTKDYFQKHVDLCHEIDEFFKNNGAEHPQFSEYMQRSKIAVTCLEKIQSGPCKKAGFLPLLKAYTHHDGFAKLMDAETHLIGFDNGVYDLRERTFRPYTQDTYVTLSVGYDYPTDCPYKGEIKQFFRQVFPDKDVRDYMKTFLASTIGGENKHDLFFFWTGEDSKQTGANGKSTLCKLLKFTLGQYYLQGNPAVITTDRGNSKSADPCLLQFKGKRFISFEEIEGTVNMNKIKEYTGGNELEARGLFKDPESFSPTWNLVTCCNEIPKISDDKGGARRRIRKIPFESKFVDDVEDEQWEGMKHVFPVNTDLRDELKNWRSSFMYLLIHWYHELYEANGLGEDMTPDRIKEATQEVFDSQHDELYEFLDSLIMPDPQGLENKRYVKFTDIKQAIQGNVSKRYKQKELYDLLRIRYKEFYSKDYNDRTSFGSGQQVTNVIKGHILCS